jgi:dephospho-CoA kinase
MKKVKKQKIIAIIGAIASGKGTAADFFVKKYGFKKITMSDFLRQEARRRKVHPNRVYFRKLQNELRIKLGQNILVEMARQKIKENPGRSFVIDGLRDYREAKYAKKKLKLKIILIDADAAVRFKRQKERHRNGFSQTYPEFLHEDAVENALFDFYKTKKLADFRIFSDAGKDSLYKQLGKLVKQRNL